MDGAAEGLPIDPGKPGGGGEGEHGHSATLCHGRTVDYAHRYDKRSSLPTDGLLIWDKHILQSDRAARFP